MAANSRQRYDRRDVPIVWFGECVCGLIAFELADGMRFVYATRKRHSREDCERQRQRIASEHIDA